MKNMHSVADVPRNRKNQVAVLVVCAFVLIFISEGCGLVRTIHNKSYIKRYSAYKKLSKDSFAIKYEFFDYPLEHRIELFFRNDLGHTVCLFESYWPIRAIRGEAFFEGPGAELVVGDRHFPSTRYEGSLDHCIGGCLEILDPNQEIRASIPYAVFQLPESLYNENKRIEFHPQAYFCERNTVKDK